MFRDLFVYLRIIFFNWYLLILFIPDLFGIAQTYFNLQMKLPSFIDNYLGIWAFLFFFIASFSAWRELKREGKNGADFEVSYIVQEISTDLEENIKKAKNEILLLNKEIKKNEDELSTNSDSSSFNRYILIASQVTKDRKVELEQYIVELNSLIEHYKQWKKIIFYIKNTGTEYESNIRINMKMQKGIILSDNRLNYELKNPPDYPNKEDAFIHVPGILNRDNLPIYRVKIGDWKYEIRDLHIGNDTEIFYSGEGIIVGIGDFEIDFEISSKNTKKVIKKNLKIKVE